MVSVTHAIAQGDTAPPIDMLAAGLEESELKFQRHVTPVGAKIRDAVVR